MQPKEAVRGFGGVGETVAPLEDSTNPGRVEALVLVAVTVGEIF